MSVDAYSMPVGCFGTPGSYSYRAMKEHFAGKSIQPSYYGQFADLVQAVADGTVRYGVLPIENSTTGGITEVYDLIHRLNCHIVGEKYVKVEHHLLTIPGTRLEDIHTV